MPSKLAQADIKTRAMLDAVWDFETHTVQSEPESLLLEANSSETGRYNISFRDDKRFLVNRSDRGVATFRSHVSRKTTAPVTSDLTRMPAPPQTLNFMRKKFGVLTFGRGSPTGAAEVSDLSGSDALERNQRGAVCDGSRNLRFLEDIRAK
jgi:excinuclease ABC subunit C